jgi:hypothetical protein
MVAMEEGTVPGRWDNGGRVVLLGDSVSKVSSITQTRPARTVISEARCALTSSSLPSMLDLVVTLTSKPLFA